MGLAKSQELMIVRKLARTRVSRCLSREFHRRLACCDLSNFDLGEAGFVRIQPSVARPAQAYDFRCLTTSVTSCEHFRLR
jgi:hypothetical protein